MEIEHRQPLVEMSVSSVWLVQGFNLQGSLKLWMDSLAGEQVRQRGKEQVTINTKPQIPPDPQDLSAPPSSYPQLSRPSWYPQTSPSLILYTVLFQDSNSFLISYTEVRIII